MILKNTTSLLFFARKMKILGRWALLSSTGDFTSNGPSALGISYQDRLIFQSMCVFVEYWIVLGVALFGMAYLGLAVPSGQLVETTGQVIQH